MDADQIIIELAAAFDNEDYYKLGPRDRLVCDYLEAKGFIKKGKSGIIRDIN